MISRSGFYVRNRKRDRLVTRDEETLRASTGNDFFYERKTVPFLKWRGETGD